MTSELTGKQRIQIADILYNHYLRTNGYGKQWIQPLPAIVREVFGKERLTQYPMYPQKKLRDFLEERNLTNEEVLTLLARLSENAGKGSTDKLVSELNMVLAQVGLKLVTGKIITLAEVEVKLIEDEVTFLSKLESLGFNDIKERLEKGLEGLREQDPDKASSNCSLAFDALLKKK